MYWKTFTAFIVLSPPQKHKDTGQMSVFLFLFYDKSRLISLRSRDWMMWLTCKAANEASQSARALLRTKGRQILMGITILVPHRPTRCQVQWNHLQNNLWVMSTHLPVCPLRRYFGFITKHPADHRFACHVFVSENSTKPLAESVGWVARSTLIAYFDTYQLTALGRATEGGVQFLSLSLTVIFILGIQVSSFKAIANYIY